MLNERLIRAWKLIKHSWRSLTQSGTHLATVILYETPAALWKDSTIAKNSDVARVSVFQSFIESVTVTFPCKSVSQTTYQWVLQSDQKTSCPTTFFWKDRLERLAESVLPSHQASLGDMEKKLCDRRDTFYVEMKPPPQHLLHNGFVAMKFAAERRSLACKSGKRMMIFYFFI